MSVPVHSNILSVPLNLPYFYYVSYMVPPTCSIKSDYMPNVPLTRRFRDSHVLILSPVTMWHFISTSSIIEITPTYIRWWVENPFLIKWLDL